MSDKIENTNLFEIELKDFKMGDRIQEKDGRGVVYASEYKGKETRSLLLTALGSLIEDDEFKKEVLKFFT
jgi:hypothetical protein